MDLKLNKWNLGSKQTLDIYRKSFIESMSGQASAATQIEEVLMSIRDTTSRTNFTELNLV